MYLEVAGNVVSCEAIHAHDLKDPGRHGLVDAQLLHRLHEPPVQLRRPVHLMKVIYICNNTYTNIINYTNYQAYAHVHIHIYVDMHVVIRAEALVI